MATLDSTTRPANVGGIDISGIDPAWAVFEGSGGGHGAPRQTLPAAGDTPLRTADWVTNGGKGDLKLEIDVAAPEGDPDAPYKLVAEPEFSHPLLDLLGGQGEPVLSDGGPEGAAHPAVIVGAILIVGAMIAAGGHLSGAFDGPKEKDGSDKYEPKIVQNPDGGLPIMVNDCRDPDADPAPLGSPAEMFGHLVASPGMPVIEAGKIAIGNPLAELSDRLAKIMDLIASAVGAAGAAEGTGGELPAPGAGASGGAPQATDLFAELLGRLGLDADAFDFRTLTPPSQDFPAGMFEAAGITGGPDGAALRAAAEATGLEAGQIGERIADLAGWLDGWTDGIA